MSMNQLQPRVFPRGARPTPRCKLARARPFLPINAPAGQAAWVPARLSNWGNDQYGDCVSAEEAFAKATYHPELFVDDQTVIHWAQQNGFLDGADLTSVMDAMARSGFPYQGDTLNDGPYRAVDYSSEAILQAALDVAVVKIGIDANALPGGAGNQMGWTAFGGAPESFTNEDHCVSVAGYGPVAWLAAQLGVQPPSGAPPSGYLLYTWKTIGIVDHAWLMSTCGEAWLRNPLTVVAGPTPIPPDPGPTPLPPVPPVPPGPGKSLTLDLNGDQVASAQQQLGGAPLSLDMTLRQLLQLVPQLRR